MEEFIYIKLGLYSANHLQRELSVRGWGEPISPRLETQGGKSSKRWREGGCDGAGAEKGRWERTEIDSTRRERLPL